MERQSNPDRSKRKGAVKVTFGHFCPMRCISPHRMTPIGIALLRAAAVRGCYNVPFGGTELLRPDLAELSGLSQSDQSREGNVPLRRASSPARGSPHNLPYAPRAGLPEVAGGRARPGPAPPGRGGAFRVSASAAVGARCGGGQHAEPAGARRGAGPLLHGDGAAAAPPRAHRLQGHGAGESAPPGAAPPPPGPQPRPAARSQAAAAALPFAFPGRLGGRRAGIVVQGPLSAGLRGLGPLPCDGAGCLSPPSSH